MIGQSREEPPVRRSDRSELPSGGAVAVEDYGPDAKLIEQRAAEYARLKRGIDILVSGVALVCLSPLLLVVAILVRLDSPGPAVFKQNRVGLRNTRFVIYKFRTMRTDTPDVAKSQITRTDSRITRLGRTLRQTSLDELPQLVNVLKGDMSLVGPTPALYNQYDLIEMRTRAGVHLVKPGMTGLAQVSGREDLSLSRKVELDQQYAVNTSIWIDLRLLIQTPITLLSPRGVY